MTKPPTEQCLTPEGMARTGETFRQLYAAALVHGGSFYLTYGRYATRDQVEQAYPQFADFLWLKRRYDPAERFTSNWYRHFALMFA